MEFNVGDRVVGVGSEDGIDLSGKTGTIRVVRTDDFSQPYGVQWDEPDSRMHNLHFDGMSQCKDHYGWWCKGYNLTMYEDVDYDSLGDLNELLKGVCNAV